MNNKPMLNAYPDSLGGKLSDIAALLKKKDCLLYTSPSPRD